MIDLPTPEMRKVTLDVLAVGAQFVASKAVVEANPHMIPGLATDLALQLRSYVLAHHLAADEYTRTIEIPATTWHFFRDRHRGARWQRWLEGRRPIRYYGVTVTVTVDRYLTYPDAAIRTPDMGAFQILERVS